VTVPAAATCGCARCLLMQRKAQHSSLRINAEPVIAIDSEDVPAELAQANGADHAVQTR